ncbi:MAG: methylenetetrahydrofolate reductase [NAD(P)H] [Planctomycetota bacterium]|nr:methylenetetrahydrofolate reductase [NAD(P)H] [Planctomycetaceae bacterium]MDQ3332604.1 methylenetetrahydrofolate reductase [NAD(P)H] [Planctomycetota bacterium]
MTHLRDIYSDGRFGLSVEIFPPKTPAGDADLLATLEELSRYRPAFVSCTYGAGGSTRGRTIDWCRAIQERFGLPATAHFTCVGSCRAELLDWLREAQNAGVRNIMALRGDVPRGETTFQVADDGLRYAAELVRLIKQNFAGFGIGVAGYPEKHPEAQSIEIDREHLRQKVANGADAVFTQLFFVNRNFFRFRDAAAKAGIDVPIIPGIMPITSFDRIKRITAMCGAVFPGDLAGRLEDAKSDTDAQFKIGVEYAIEQCRGLIDAGVPGMHFYVLNRSQACSRIFDALGFPSTVGSM